MSKIAEIVSFTLNAGVSDEDYIALTEPSHAYISQLQGFVSRNLSKGEDGAWTDYTIWDDMDCAKSAADGFMAQPFAPAMIAAIDESSLSMRHQAILWQPQ